MSKHDWRPTPDQKQILNVLEGADDPHIPIMKGIAQQAFIDQWHYRMAYEADHASLEKQGVLLVQMQEELSELRAKCTVPGTRA